MAKMNKKPIDNFESPVRLLVKSKNETLYKYLYTKHKTQNTYM